MTEDEAIERLRGIRLRHAGILNDDEVFALAIGAAAIRCMKARAATAVAALDLETTEKGTNLPLDAPRERYEAAAHEEDAAAEEYGKALRGEA